MKLRCLTPAIVLLCLPASLCSAEFQYQLTPISNPAGTQWVAGPGADSVNSGPVINTSHQIALTYLTSSDNYQPYIWDNGAFTALPLTIGDASGGAAGINDHGDVVGYQRNAAETMSNPIVWIAGSPVPLDQQDQSYGVATSINNSGQIGGMLASGFAITQTTTTTAALWNAGTLENLGNFGSQQASISKVTANGVVLINVDSQYATAQVFLRADDGTVTPVGAAGTSATNMNSLNHVVGTKATAGSNDGYPFLWNDGTFTQLAPAFGSDPAINFAAFAVNQSDMVVGSAGGIGGPIYAALWSQGNLYDLNDLIAPDPDWHLWMATDIADDGTIVGIGQDDGNWQAFVLTPTPGGQFDLSSRPEPATLPLLAVACLSLFTRRRKP